MDHQTKMAAVAAAVMAYIQTEEELLLTRAAAPALPAAAPPAAAPRLWGLSGRQDAMQTRTLMQLRAFHGRAPR